MGSLLNHNSTHDVYNYPPITGNYIDSSNYSNNISSFPISYNTSCWIKDPIYNLPKVDFSGISLRTRGAPTYGFDTFSSRSDMDPSGLIKGWTGGNELYGTVVYDRLSGTTNVFPTAFRFLNDRVLGGTGSFDSLNPGTPAAYYGYYYPGRPLGNTDIAEDWQNWNCGFPCGVLISPRHVLVTAHFVGIGGNATFFFLGKNNVIYSKSSTQIYRTNNFFGGGAQILNPPGYDLGSGPDVAIYELSEKFTEDELQQVKVYKMLDIGSITNFGVNGASRDIGTTIPIFTLWNQGFVTVKKAGSNRPYFDLDTYPNAAHLGGRNYVDGIPGLFVGLPPEFYSPNYGATFTQSYGPIIPNKPLFPLRGRYFSETSYYWVGDSGTPDLIYVPSLNETCFIELQFGAGGYIGNKWSPTNNYFFQLEKFWKNVKQYVYENTDPPYTMQFIEYADVVVPRSPYKSFINVDGITYYAQFEYDSLPGQLGTGERSLSSFLTPGITYSFAVIAVSKSGQAISEPVTLRDIHFPRGATQAFPNIIT